MVPTKYFKLLVCSLVIVSSHARSPDEILDSCEASGTKIGINMARRGCEAVKNECFSDGNSRIRARLAAHGSLADLVGDAINRSCDTLFRNRCLKSGLKAVESLGDNECLKILNHGPDKKTPNCENTADALKIFQDALVDCSNPCACSSDGVANGINTQRKGCKQHLKLYDDYDHFCYVVDSDHCTSEEITESKAFPGTFWILCGESKKVKSSEG